MNPKSVKPVWSTGILPVALLMATFLIAVMEYYPKVFRLANKRFQQGLSDCVLVNDRE
jgi:hypothetical protein